MARRTEGWTMTPLERLRSNLVSADCQEIRRVSVATEDLRSVLALIPAAPSDRIMGACSTCSSWNSANRWCKSKSFPTGRADTCLDWDLQ